ncbi:hypothetical protein LTR78_002581 [Recurvomyces mirabilis]|uniref:DUF8004 domain-containing protein n=1 Tax=Recurvomyces mirabilis TaxID=574656 RepID=A0AAE1C4K7_9PEZI|nr:hypothetical protein LTR78_002581 [Recurvomyces mirabilis]KAK5157510.1 hypothetical protein LTS14_004275 [Recurvomyces mirabilis]
MESLGSITGLASSSPPTTPSRRRGSVRHFNGAEKSSNEWDGLRKDTKLWFDDADCLIHLYTLGGSQRGPSLRLWFADIEALRCDYLQDECLFVREPSSPSKVGVGDSDSACAAAHISRSRPHRCDLYIPAPANLTRDQAFAYHLTTRNFFAYATKQPLVGEKLGVALLDLLQRVREWLPRTAALANFTSYCEDQGYTDMTENPGHSLACLHLAESAKFKDLWVESFVHCVGMRDRLSSSHEYEVLSNTTKALVTRASLEMDLHIARVTRALGSFLEEELGLENLGLSKPARDHLERFRSFLHNYYVDKLGYFPPDEEGPWNKRLWTKMYHAFQTLYVFLVDNEADPDAVDTRWMTGGICVVQNVEAFDARHGYTPLPHPLPLLPQASCEQPRGLRGFKLGRSSSYQDKHASTRATLENATNAVVQEVMGCELVAEYQRFERKRLEEKISPAEARKVRWLLIYGVLQMLISITRAPKELRDTEGPSYPLCVLTAGGPSWLTETAADTTRNVKLPVANSTMLQPLTVEDVEEKLSIHPDCEADNAEDYFSSQAVSRQASVQSFDMTPAPLRITTQLSTTASIRSTVHSGVNALQRSFKGSVSRHNSIRPAAQAQPLSKTPSSGSFCEIMIEGYGNGADAERESGFRESVLSVASASDASDTAAFAAFDFGLANVTEEPSLDECHLHGLLEDDMHAKCAAESLGRSNSDSSTASKSSAFSTSTHSLSSDLYDSPATDLSCWDSDDSKRNSEVHMFDSPTSLPVIYESPPETRRQSYQQPKFAFGTTISTRAAKSSVHGGCYTPSGQPRAQHYTPTSKLSEQRRPSLESIKSTASSSYAEGGQQASEIEEEQIRGRRRSRALDRISSEEMDAEGRSLRYVE